MVVGATSNASIPSFPPAGIGCFSEIEDGYNASTGQLASITYPDGKVLQHQYDSTGQLSALVWNNQPLVSAITWNPLGQPTGWTWHLQGSQGSSSQSVTRSYDTAGQLTTSEIASYQYNAAGRIETLTQNLWAPASTNPLEHTVQEQPITWAVQYDTAGRITGFTRQSTGTAETDATTYQYDTNGNRTASTSERTLAGTTGPITTSTSRSYATDPAHNQLLGFEQTQSATDPATGEVNTATTSVAYSYDAACNQQGDGLNGPRRAAPKPSCCWCWWLSWIGRQCAIKNIATSAYLSSAGGQIDSIFTVRSAPGAPRLLRSP